MDASSLKIKHRNLTNRKRKTMSFSFSRTGKRDEAAREILEGDHHAIGDQTQFDEARQYIHDEVMRAATPQHDVHVTVEGHHRDEGIDPSRQYRRIRIEIVSSPGSETSGPLGISRQNLNVPGLTTETIRAAETIRTNTPHLGEGPDAGTVVAGGPRTEVALPPTPPDAPPMEKVDTAPRRPRATVLTTETLKPAEAVKPAETLEPVTGEADGLIDEAKGLIDEAKTEQSQGQVKTQNALIDAEKPASEGGATTAEEQALDAIKKEQDAPKYTSPADEKHEAGQDHLVGETEPQEGD